MKSTKNKANDGGPSGARSRDLRIKRPRSKRANTPESKAVASVDVGREPRVSRKVTLKLKERERGLAGVCAGPRGYDVRIDGRRVGAVYAMGGGWRGEVSGWYFVIMDDKLGIPLRNTCGEVGVPLEDVKTAAIAYVKQCLTTKAGGAK